MTSGINFVCSTPCIYSHFNNFLCDPTRKQSATSKRVQEGTSSEGPPMANPKPLNPAMAKSRPTNLVLHNPMSARNNSSQNLRDPVNLGNVDEELGDRTSSGKPVRTNPTQKPVEFSQVRRQENTQQADSWKQGDRRESSNATGFGKPERAVHARADFQNMKKITSYQWMTKVFRYLQKEVGNHNRLNICNGNDTDQRLDLGVLHVFVNESSHSSWTKIHRELGSIQENELRGNAEFIQYHTEIGSEEILIVHMIDSTSPSHDQVVQWTKTKSTCLLRLRTVSGEDVTSFRSNSKMGRSSGRNSNVRFLRRIAGNRWRSN